MRWSCHVQTQLGSRVAGDGGGGGSLRWFRVSGEVGDDIQELLNGALETRESFPLVLQRVALWVAPKQTIQGCRS